MKLVKKASGKTVVKMSKVEWERIGKKAGWLNKASGLSENDPWREYTDDRIEEESIYPTKSELINEKFNDQDMDIEKYEIGVFNFLVNFIKDEKRCESLSDLKSIIKTIDNNDIRSRILDKFSNERVVAELGDYFSWRDRHSFPKEYSHGDSEKERQFKKQFKEYTSAVVRELLR